MPNGTVTKWAILIEATETFRGGKNKKQKNRKWNRIVDIRRTMRSRWENETRSLLNRHFGLTKFNDRPAVIPARNEFWLKFAAPATLRILRLNDSDDHIVIVVWRWRRRRRQRRCCMWTRMLGCRIRAYVRCHLPSLPLTLSRLFHFITIRAEVYCILFRRETARSFRRERAEARSKPFY